MDFEQVTATFEGTGKILSTVVPETHQTQLAIGNRKCFGARAGIRTQKKQIMRLVEGTDEVGPSEV